MLIDIYKDIIDVYQTSREWTIFKTKRLVNLTKNKIEKFYYLPGNQLFAFHFFAHHFCIPLIVYWESVVMTTTDGFFRLWSHAITPRISIRLLVVFLNHAEISFWWSPHLKITPYHPGHGFGLAHPSEKICIISSAFVFMWAII